MVNHLPYSNYSIEHLLRHRVVQMKISAIDGRKTQVIQVSGPFQMWRDVLVQALAVTGFCVATYLVISYLLVR